jgi:hypothetical protein
MKWWSEDEGRLACAEQASYFGKLNARTSQGGPFLQCETRQAGSCNAPLLHYSITP